MRKWVGGWTRGRIVKEEQLAASWIKGKWEGSKGLREREVPKYKALTRDEQKNKNKKTKEERHAFHRVWVGGRLWSISSRKEGGILLTTIWTNVSNQLAADLIFNMQVPMDDLCGIYCGSCILVGKSSSYWSSEIMIKPPIWSCRFAIQRAFPK